MVGCPILNSWHLFTVLSSSVSLCVPAVSISCSVCAVSLPAILFFSSNNSNMPPSSSSAISSLSMYFIITNDMWDFPVTSALVLQICWDNRRFPVYLLYCQGVQSAYYLFLYFFQCHPHYGGTGGTLTVPEFTLNWKVFTVPDDPRQASWYWTTSFQLFLNSNNFLIAACLGCSGGFSWFKIWWTGFGHQRSGQQSQYVNIPETRKK